MMTEVVNHGYSTLTATDFLAAGDSFETREGGLNHLWRDSVKPGGDCGHRCVANIELANQGRIENGFA